jgi:sigma-B regulation protein RsbU (phosphoserine phosphatase)
MISASLSPVTEHQLRHQLVDRRARLSSLRGAAPANELGYLLQEIDSALERMEHGSYGTCAVCEASVDESDLVTNPLAVYCLCQLSPERSRELEQDLALAWRVQAGLLPDPKMCVDRWTTAYRYIPAGAVSGDYCDLLAHPSNPGGLFFALGDVSGKGIAASLLMSQLHAAFRTIVPGGCELAEVLARVDQLISAATIASQFATIVFGCGNDAGGMEFVNAGHCRPLLVSSSGVRPFDSTHAPIGLSVAGHTAAACEAHRFEMSEGDVLVLYTDGLVEAANRNDEEYGEDRLASVLDEHRGQPPAAVIQGCLQDLDAFQAGEPRRDDLTVLAIQRANPAN